MEKQEKNKNKEKNKEIKEKLENIQDKIEDKTIYNIPVDNIKSITVSKFGLGVTLKISFISEEGRLEKKKYGFSTFVLGSAEQKDNAKKLLEGMIKSNAEFKDYKIEYKFKE